MTILTPSRERACFYLIVALQALLPWLFPYFPSCDGPSHVHNGVQLWGWLGGDPLLREYFTINPLPESNWFGHLLLGGLVHLTNPFIGERLLLMLWFILFPLSLRYALRAVAEAGSKPNYWIAWLALPFSYNWLLHNGFYFNLLSLPVMFATIGWFYPRREALDARQAGKLAGWLLLLYFTHIVTLAMTLLAMACLMTFAPRQPETAPRRKAWKWFVLAAIPSLILLLVVQADRVRFAGWGEPEVAFTKRIVALGSLYYGMVAYSMRELVFGAAVALGVLAFCALVLFPRLRHGVKSIAQAGLLVAALLATLIFLISPESLAHGWYLVHRLNVYPFLLLLLWLGTQPAPRLARLVPFAFGVLAVFQLAYYGNIYRGLQPYLREYVQLGASIPEGSTLLAIGVSNRGHATNGQPLAIRTKPFEFGASRIGLDRGVIVLNDYQAHIGNFPLQYRPGRDPFDHIGNVLMEPPRFEKGGPVTYPERTGGQVDYILWWQDTTDKLKPEHQAAYEAALASGYELVARSQPHGYGRLYRRTGQ